MAHRDYAMQRNSKKKKNVKLKLAIILLIIISVIAGLMWLKQSAPESAVVNQPVVEKPAAPKSQLPTPPQEQWSYIQALESRVVPVDNNPKTLEQVAQITPEQRQKLIELEQAEKARLAQEQAARKAQEAEKAAQQKAAAEKAAAQNAQTKTQAQSSSTAKASEKPAPVAVKDSVKSSDTAKSAGKFGLQCGTFKSQQNAENLQAKLVMSGFNARVVASGENFHRVMIGPVGDRAQSAKMQTQAKSVANCIIVGM